MARNMRKIFSLVPLKKPVREKIETNKGFTFQLLIDEIDQNTNFTKLTSAKWHFLV